MRPNLPNAKQFPVVAAVLAALSLAACGAAQVPTTQVADAQAAIRAADEVGASQEPKAALHLQLAREGYAKAMAYIEDDETHRARLSLARADADAELAVALAREASTKAAAQQALDQIRGAQPSGLME